MKSAVNRAIITNTIPLLLTLIVISLGAATPAQARNDSNNPGRQLGAAVLIRGHQGLIRDTAELRAKLLRALANKAKLNPTPAGAAKGCGCGVMPSSETGGFWSCMKGCLQDAGVSYVEIVGCTASCVFVETGVGAILCAICVGVNATVIEVCVLGCAMEGGKGFGDLMDARTLKQRKGSPGTIAAKLPLKLAKMKS